MMPSDLHSRLDLIKKQASDKTINKNDASSAARKAEQSLLSNSWNRIDDMVFERISISDNPLEEIISDFLIPAKVKSADLVFYDTETTGLSGGAGNIVFLAGFGFIDAGHFKTVQLMLTDFPGEPSFLARMKNYINPEKTYVSYNGKSFDSNILKTRFSLNGMSIEFGYQLDLLYPSRRLWKNIIGSCSLGDIEREILRKKRILDVPGALVPDLFFHFIKNGDYSAMEGVVSHHYEDILSLAQLLSFFEKIGGNPAGAEGVDCRGLAAQLISRHPEDALAVLEAEFRSGNYLAAKTLGYFYKQNSDPESAKNVWLHMWNKNRSIVAGLELAKLFEHKERNFSGALNITNEILSFEHFRIKTIRPELEKRKTRLEKKITAGNNQ